MTTTERKTGQENIADVGYNFADLPMIALNHVRTDKDLIVTATDTVGLVRDLSFRKKMPDGEVLKQLQMAADGLSVFDTSFVEKVPFKIDHLRSLLDLTLHFYGEPGSFEKDGSLRAFDPDFVVAQVAEKRRLSADQVLQNVQNSRDFLSDVVSSNRQFLGK